MNKKFINKIMNCDCLEGMRELEDNSIDVVITDPPYGLEFMGKEWDAPWKGKASEEFNTSCEGKLGGFKKLPNYSRINNLKCENCGHWKFSGNPCKCENPKFPNAKRMAMKGMKNFVVNWGKECLRVLKPGTFCFVMSSSRQDMLSAMIQGLDEAGFNINFTSLYHVFASGFSKAMNVSLAIDKRECRKQLEEKLGRKSTKDEFKEVWKGFREVIGENIHSADRKGQYEGWGTGDEGRRYDTISATPEANILDGSYAGFQPKPAVEVILVAMKSLSEKSYVDQALKDGKGVTFLNECRAPYKSEDKPEGSVYGKSGFVSEELYEKTGRVVTSNKGRFPANLLVSDDVLWDGKGSSTVAHYPKDKRNCFSEDKHSYERDDYYFTDSGSFSRYFSLDAWWDERVKRLPESVRKVFPFLIVSKSSKGEKCEGLENRYILKVNTPQKIILEIQKYLNE